MTTQSNPLIGKYVIVRCRDAGVHAGILRQAEGRGCTLEAARRLWFWKVPKGAGDFLNGIANSGLANGSKISAAVATLVLTENCEILECTMEAEESIRSFPIYNA